MVCALFPIIFAAHECSGEFLPNLFSISYNKSPKDSTNLYEGGIETQGKRAFIVEFSGFGAIRDGRAKGPQLFHIPIEGAGRNVETGGEGCPVKGLAAADDGVHAREQLKMVEDG